MSNSKKLIKWLKNNQNKPMTVGVMAFELNMKFYFRKGFTLVDLIEGKWGTYTLEDNEDKNNFIKLMDLSNCNIDVENDSELMSIFFEEGAIEANIGEHFVIGFKLL
jgi:hypothetical protein